MEKITRTISFPEDVDQIVQNVSTNFFNGNYSLSLETIVRAADNNNINLFNGDQSKDFQTLKQVPTLLNAMDLKSVPYNGNDRAFLTNCANNFSVPFQTALFKMIRLISRYSYEKYNVYNIHNKHFIGFKENVSIYQINRDGKLNHGVYINSLEILGQAQKPAKTYIETNYYPEKEDRSFVFVSLPELNNIDDNETIFISHLERFTRSNNYFPNNDLWSHIKIALGLYASTGVEFPSHVENYLVNKYSNFSFDFNNKKIEALELSIENINTVIDYFESLL